MHILSANMVLHNRYRIVRLIGGGGMGAVYEAVDTTLSSSVAIKQLMLAGGVIGQQQRAHWELAFEREAKLLANLRHPAFPSVIDFFVEDTNHFLVMPFIAGDDLGMQIQRRGALPVDEGLLLADQLLAALEYLHSRTPSIIHRDIKPQNMKVADGQLILLDFGLAKGTAGLQTAPATSGSVAAFTRQYAPIEQIQDQGTDARSDLYASSATLYHLLTGMLPPDVLTRVAAMALQLPDPLKPASQQAPQIPGHVSAALMRAMAIKPDDRFSSAKEMRAELVAGGLRFSAIVPPAQSHPVATPQQDTTTLRLMPSAGMPAVGASPPAAAPVGQLAATPASDPTNPLLVAQSEQIGAPIKAHRRVPVWGIAVVAILVVASLASLFAMQPPGREVDTTSTQTMGSVLGLADAPTHTASTEPTLTRISSPPATSLPTATNILAPTTTAIRTLALTAKTAPTNTPTLAATATPTADAIVAVTNLNMRLGPGTNYAVVATYGEGTQLTVIGRIESSEWLKVEAPDKKTGWMLADSLSIALTLSDVILAEAPPTAVLAIVPTARSGSTSESAQNNLAPLNVNGSWYVYNGNRTGTAYISLLIVDNVIRQISTIYEDASQGDVICGDRFGEISVPISGNSFRYTATKNGRLYDFSFNFISSNKISGYFTVAPSIADVKCNYNLTSDFKSRQRDGSSQDVESSPIVNVGGYWYFRNNRDAYIDFYIQDSKITYLMIGYYSGDISNACMERFDGISIPVTNNSFSSSLESDTKMYQFSLTFHNDKYASGNLKVTSKSSGGSCDYPIETTFTYAQNERAR